MEELRRYPTVQGKGLVAQRWPPNGRRGHGILLSSPRANETQLQLCLQRSNVFGQCRGAERGTRNIASQIRQDSRLVSPVQSRNESSECLGVVSGYRLGLDRLLHFLLGPGWCGIGSS